MCCKLGVTITIGKLKNKLPACQACVRIIMICFNDFADACESEQEEKEEMPESPYTLPDSLHVNEGRKDEKPEDSIDEEAEVGFIIFFIVHILKQRLDSSSSS